MPATSRDSLADDAASLRLIAAASQRYREAGRWKAATWAGSGLLFGLGLILAITNEQTAVLALLAAAYLLCTRLVLRPEMTRAHREGVTLQEQSDVRLFGLEWNKSLGGRPIGQVDVEDLAERHRGASDRYATWYVSAGDAPAAFEVLLRQLESAAWGRRDHRRFSMVAAATAVVSVAATVIVGLIQGQVLATYVTSLAVPGLPWTLDLIELARLHARASAERGEIENDLNTLWTDATASAEPAIGTETLRGVQDRLYVARVRSGRVPTWFYAIYRGRNERAFISATREMVQQAGWGPDAE